MLIRDGRARRRWGGALVETAVVGSLTLMMIMGMIIMTLGVFRYQQVAALAREGSRWASVRGPLYQQHQGQSAPTWPSVYTNAIAPKAVGLDATRITGSLNWALTSGTSSGMVSVTVNYAWVPEAYLSPITLTSTSTVPITY